MVIASHPVAPHRVAAALRRAARRLARWHWRPARGRAPAVGFDLHAEAGAPEGALHVDGVPVGNAPRRPLA